jgi:hypothetical protein
MTRLKLLTLISHGQALDDRVGRSIGLCGVVAVIGRWSRLVQCWQVL